MPSRLWLALVSLVGTFLLLACSSSTAADPVQGKTLFQANCASCHGEDAAGGAKIGDATPADLRWSAIGGTFSNDSGLVRRAILSGKDEQGKDLDPAMPRFQGKLTDAQADSIVAYLRTLKAP